MVLTVFFSLIAILLLGLIGFRLIKLKEKFSLGDALTTLGIVVAIILALNANALISPPQTPPMPTKNLVVSPPSNTPPNTNPAPTSLPTATLAPEMTLSASFTPPASRDGSYIEDFEDRIPNDFFIGQEGTWIPTDAGPDSKVLEVASGSSSAGALFGPESFLNGSLEYRIKFLRWDLSEDNGSGNFELNFRRADVGEIKYLFILRPYFNRIQLFYVPSSGDWDTPLEGATATVNLELGVWYSLRLDVQGDTFSAFLNETPLFTVQDSQLTDSGSLSVSLGRDTTIQLDDLHVFSSP